MLTDWVLYDSSSIEKKFRFWKNVRIFRFSKLFLSIVLEKQITIRFID
ncbi:hypothetical protein LEP1GSC083_0956 [Leptospira interrogans serovar Pyrogenes str. L0374]|uniref:Uncharacterized protein n=1 Tax=Leptospira interrogans serovar Pyrogenes str. L0374 TaxID=1049928 RepID=M6KI75_LEPIR|nr:hypothetical protein LEP1GSC077_3367 [Leptospira interrogans str. C10069]EKO58867.1 hypothetical protein LEP1GSC082_2139 [Leptospira kirschneri str. H2]EMN31560.1 hypothetical protein LEP1GSC083_0956 [Leptospira interrogans serovar Pyrogenes str. L0374]EMN63384.1 hypothetical protein LEP1GSC092_1325 [Leptospira interrogans serovar Pyrogenes str. R168]